MELYFGGTIYTLKEEGQVVEAVLVDKGKIARVGTLGELKPLADTFIDLQGATMIPGLVDSHIHLMGVGEKLSRIQLGDAKSKAEIIKRLELAAKDLKESEWLIAEGWNEFNLPKHEMITLQDLDVVTTNPVILHRACHHVALVNTKVLEMAKIALNTPSIKGGKIGRDDRGVLNGMLYEEATQLALQLLPTEGEAYIIYLESSLENAIQHLHQYGIVGVHSEDCSYYGHYSNVIEAYKRTVGEKENFRVHLLRHHKVFEEMAHANLDSIEGFMEYGAMKIFADGSFGGSTAALLAPYENEGENKGILIHTEQQFEELVQVARKNNEAIAVHMIGDAAAELVVKTIEKYPTPKGKRDRLIHACLVNESLLERMKKLEIIIDIQPAFVPSDFPWIEEKLGANRMRYAYAWKTLSTYPCAMGTDAPIEDVNPFKTIAAAVQRNEYGSGEWDEALSIFDAVKMYTHGSAYAIGKEHERGLIEEHYVADFTVLQQNPFKLTFEEINQLKVEMTVVNGKMVYRNT